jgi:hypothetical protein
MTRPEPSLPTSLSDLLRSTAQIGALVGFPSQEYHAELHVRANALGHFQPANPEQKMAAA